jgi:hypothetical protein
LLPCANTDTAPQRKQKATRILERVLWIPFITTPLFFKELLTDAGSPSREFHPLRIAMRNPATHYIS